LRFLAWSSFMTTSKTQCSPFSMSGYGGSWVTTV
jgi:hypothetical protein